MPEYIVRPVSSERDPEMASYVVCTDELTEVVRCKDCKYLEKQTFGDLSLWCDAHEHLIDDSDGYCAWGER